MSAQLYSPMLARFAAYVWTRLVRIRGNCLILDSYTPKSENSSLTLYAANHGDKKRYRVETPSTQRKTLIYFSEPWRPLRLCARHVFPTSSSSPKFQISLARLDFRSENLEVGSSPQSNIGNLQSKIGSPYHFVRSRL